MVNDNGMFLIIPVRAIETLGSTRALVLGWIMYLAKLNGYCYASNAYIGKKMGKITSRQISKHINELCNEGWIRVEVDQTKGNYRKIWVVLGRQIEDEGEVIAEKSIGDIEKEAETLDENDLGIEEKEDSIEEKFQRDRNKSSIRYRTKVLYKNNIQKTNIQKNLCNSNSAELRGISLNRDIALEETAITEKINPIFNIFYKINPTLKFGNKTERKAVESLIKKIGYEKTVASANYAVSVFGVKFAPRITTPCQLERKLAELIGHFKENSLSNVFILK